MRIAVLYMNNQFGLLVKVFLLSALISTLIKYVAPSLTISAGDAMQEAINISLKDVTLTMGIANAMPLATIEDGIALIMVLSPTVIVAALLVARIALFKRT
jgi:hypothetical protein